MQFLQRALLVVAIVFIANRGYTQPATLSDIKGRWMIADTTEGTMVIDFQSDSVLKFEVLQPGMPSISMAGKFWLEFKSQQNIVHLMVKEAGHTQHTCQILKLDGDNQLTMQLSSCENPAWKDDSGETEVFRRIAK